MPTGGRLFAYGTLRDSDVLAAVLGRQPAVEGAGRLAGHVALAVVGDSYPILVPRAGAWAAGTILAGLAPADWRALDRYEGTGYRRLAVRIVTTDGTVMAEAYFPAKGLKPGALAWDLDDWTRRHKPAFLRRLRP
jgi:gamma-glutamylcyclotransferase (GGCT)/AIG2-like uncharacterized protein YtfP